MMQAVELKREKILSRLAVEDFIGRTRETDEILRHAKNGSNLCGMLILSAPGNGLSELLRQVYDQLFFVQGEIIPVYLNVKTKFVPKLHYLNVTNLAQTLVSQG